MTFLDGTSEFHETIGQSRLTMINMSNDGEISDLFGRKLGQINWGFSGILSRIRAETVSLVQSDT